MKTIKTRVEDLEKRHETKPILVLWGDWNDETVCRAGDTQGEPMPWEDAKERFGNDYFLICVKYVEDWRP
jgi:hypothetical protein